MNRKKIIRESVKNILIQEGIIDRFKAGYSNERKLGTVVGSTIAGIRNVFTDEVGTRQRIQQGKADRAAKQFKAKLADTRRNSPEGIKERRDAAEAAAHQEWENNHRQWHPPVSDDKYDPRKGDVGSGDFPGGYGPKPGSPSRDSFVKERLRSQGF